MFYLINITISNDEINTFNNFDYKYIFLGNTINNRILENGKFTRIYYSTSLCSFNGIYMLINFSNITESNKSNSPNNKIILNIEENKNILKQIKSIEEKILEVFNIKNKTLTTNIYNDLSKGIIKLNYKNNLTNIMLKISGIWETNNAFGLSYKYYYLKKKSL